MNEDPSFYAKLDGIKACNVLSWDPNVDQKMDEDP